MTKLEATIQSDDLKSVLDAVTVLVEEARVFLENDEVLIRGTDPAGVGIVQATISEGAFEEPEISQASMCLDFTEFTNMVNTVNNDADVYVQIGEHDMDINILDLDFSLSLIDPETLNGDQAIPDLDLSAEVVISSSALKRGIKAGSLVAEHIEFGISESDSAFYMRAKGDSNEVLMEKKEEDLGALTTDSVSSTFSLSYLTDIEESIPTNTNVGINLGDEHPAEISFDLIDGNATVTYFLAPRLEPNS